MKTVYLKAKKNVCQTLAGFCQFISEKKAACSLMLFGLLTGNSTLTAFAGTTGGTKSGTDTLTTLLNNMISIIGIVFQAIGILLAAYSIGQLVLAFKNEDADSKSRASATLVVSIVLIALPSIISGLGLVDNLGTLPTGGTKTTP